ncbi:helix-turn-helix transcriptional regulator [Patescibacteria group bacterium]|nr:helix-turn-helix transcriptional regulator [Patescibacteria group bacterium]MBU4016425.1 helix-turn-helix transcriptional regulator [Patescibacteria group bacterium]
MNLNELKKELSKNQKVKEEFETYDLTYEISQMIIEARIIKGITQKNLAEMIHTKQSGIARAERGISLPSLSFLNKIAKALSTHLNVRFSFMDDMKIKVNEKSQNTLQSEKRIVTNQNSSAHNLDFACNPITFKAEPNSISDTGGVYA